MLKRLVIRNYALIEEVELEFGRGFTVITGETGSGKSIMLGALSLLLGNRSDSRVARSSKARVEAVFEDVDPDLRTLLDDKGVEWIEYPAGIPGPRNELTIRREISAEGRSRVYINDTSVTLATLSLVGPRLIDIHSQMSNSKIGDNAEQLAIVDAYSGNVAEQEAYRASFRRFVRLKRGIGEIKARMAKSRENEQFLRFQCEQLDKLKPTAGELPEIEKRYEMLSDADEIKEQLGHLEALLSDNDGGMLAALTEARSVTGHVDFSLFGREVREADIPGRLDALQAELKDISETVADVNATIDTDPATLGKLSARMKAYYDAVKHFKATSADELVEIHERLRKELNEITYGGDELPELEQAARAEAKELKRLANELTATRRRGAAALGLLIRDKASRLGLPHLEFNIAVTEGKLTPNGQDHTEFLCSFNKNGELRPLGKTASGGEMSRLMLSLKAVVAERMNMPTIIFDEVDTGVSGDIADRMGVMMRDMGRDMQVMAITHLPQVASQGERQFKVRKEDDENRTVTRVELLDDEQRVREIASMISGSEVTEAAVSNARALMEGARSKR